MTSRYVFVALCGLLLTACGGGTDSTTEVAQDGTTAAAQPGTPLAAEQYTAVLTATRAMEEAMLTTVPAQTACEAGVDVTCQTALKSAVDASTAALTAWKASYQTALAASSGACRESLDGLSTQLGTYLTTLTDYSGAVDANSDKLVPADDALTESRDTTVPAARDAFVKACGP